MNGMFRILDESRGTSVSNTYATPIAVKSTEWSYFDPKFFVEGSRRDLDGFYVTSRDWRYLWFADRSNPVYLRPRYFVCWMHLNFKDLVGRPEPCGSLAGIAEIRKGRAPFEHREIARDMERDLWSIIELDWNGASTDVKP